MKVKKPKTKTPKSPKTPKTPKTPASQKKKRRKSQKSRDRRNRYCKMVKEQRRLIEKLQNPSTSNYQDELDEFLALRNSTSETAKELSSKELIWVRDDSIKQEDEGANLSKPSTSTNSTRTSQVIQPIEIEDGEIEDGEIVESDLNDIVDLLAESFVETQSGASQEQLFFEDRNGSVHKNNPKYIPFNQTPKTADVIDLSDDVICLGSQEDKDDSVIFVSENKAPTASLNPPSCLGTPLVNNLMKLAGKSPKLTKSQLKAKRLERTQMWKLKRRAAMILENTAKKAKQASPTKASTSKAAAAKANTNVTSPPAAVSGPSPAVVSTPSIANTFQPAKRIILIDGSNVAMQYSDSPAGKKTDKDFSAEGLKIVIDHFEKLGHPVKAIVPEYRVRREKSSNHALMTELKDSGKLVCTPSKSYDDRVILESAVKLDAAVVSNDHYRDLSNQKKEFREVVESSLIRFNWMFKQLIIPEDPYGRAPGRQLSDILNKKT